MMERSHDHHEDSDDTPSGENRPRRAPDAAALHAPLRIEFSPPPVARPPEHRILPPIIPFDRPPQAAAEHSAARVETDDDDDEDEDEESEEHQTARQAPQEQAPVELPRRPIPLPRFEQFGPPPELADDELEDDEEPVVTPPHDAVAPPPMPEVTPPRPLNTAEFWATYGPGVYAEAPAPPAHETTVNPNEVVLEAATDNLDPNASPRYVARHAAPPPTPAAANLAPSTPNSPSPPGGHNYNAPPAGGNTPPQPPFIGGPGNHNAHQYYYAQGFNPNITPTPNFAPTAPTIVVERERVVERQGNILAVIAIIGLIAEVHKRKKSIRNLTGVVKKQQEALDELRSQQTLQEAVRHRHERETDRSSAQAQPNVLTNDSSRQVTEHQRAAEAFTPSPTLRPAESLPPRPVAPEQRPGVATALFGPELQQPVIGEQQELETPAFAVQPEQHVERSAWHNIVVDSRGREVADAIQYGQGFQQERQREAAPQVQQSTSVAVGGSMASGATNTQGPQIGDFSQSLPSGMTTPSLPVGQSAYQDSQHRLPVPQHPLRDTFVTILLWVLVAVFAFAAVTGARLLF